MTPDEIKSLRAELKCTARELAGALSLEQATVLAWEAGELFPTKKHVDAMEALRAKGPSAIPKKAKGAQPAPMRVLSDPQLWEVVRKLATHKKLRDEVFKLASTYADPAEELDHEAARSRIASISRGTTPYASAAASSDALCGRCVRNASA